jgi:hypothetical protein
MVAYDEAVQLRFDARDLLRVVRAYEAIRASDERREVMSEGVSEEVSEWNSAEMIARKRSKRTRMIAEKARMRAEIDGALDELEQSVKGLRKTLKKEGRDIALAKQAKVVNDQKATDSLNNSDAEYKGACDVVSDSEYDLRVISCIADARAILATEPRIPPDIRLRTLVLLAETVPDLREALHFHRRADRLLRVTREHQVKGASADRDVMLDEVEESVEKLQLQLAAEAQQARVLQLVRVDSAMELLN